MSIRHTRLFSSGESSFENLHSASSYILFAQSFTELNIEFGVVRYEILFYKIHTIPSKLDFTTESMEFEKATQQHC